MGQSDIPFFKVKICSNRKIEIEIDRNLELGDVTDPCEVNLDPLRRQTIEILIDMLRDNRMVHNKDFEVLGSHLYSVLFYKTDGTYNQIGEKLHQALNREDETLKLIRVELAFQSDDRDVLDLASWPWEYLYCPIMRGRGGTGYFLSTVSKLVLSRYLPLAGEARELLVQSKDYPIKVLFVAASPCDLDEVQYQRVLEEIKDLANNSNGRIKVYELIGSFVKSDELRTQDYDPKATYNAFLELAGTLNPHVIHFIGHGKCGHEHGQIAFMDRAGKAHFVDDTDLASELWQIRSLRLVFLQACETAQRPVESYQAVSGVAMQLAFKCIPAVVAIQHRIENRSANLFARAFYSALASSKLVDEAVQAGRLEIKRENWKLPQGRAFGLPVLYATRPGALLAPELPGGGSQGGYSTSPSSAVVGIPLPATCQYCPGTNTAQAKYCGECSAELRCHVCDTPVREKRERCYSCNAVLQGPRSGFDVKSLRIVT